MSYDLSNYQLVGIVILALWELVWKALALWRAAERRQLGWFVAILFINTAGLLPIYYLYLVAPPKDNGG